MARAAIRVVPRGCPAVPQPLPRPPPSPGLRHREGPVADVERADVRPEESHLLLPGPDDLIAITDGRLQGELIAGGVRIPPTVADASVQKNAPQPVGSSTSTTRITPPGGRHVARS